MARSLFLLIISSIIGAICNPIILAAADDVALSGLDNAGVVETVPLPEPEPVVIAKAPDAGVVRSSINVTPVAPVYANSLTIAGRTLEVVDVANTAVDAGGHVNRYGKLLYGHNSAGVFGVLSSIGVGSVFTVTNGGMATSYVVREVATYAKISDTKLELDGVGYRMTAIVNAKGRYSLALMTCAGEMYGNGDASHRLVIFADAI